MDRINLIEGAARSLGDFIGIGTVSAATGTTVDVGRFVHPFSDQMKGKWMYSKPVGTVAPGQSRVITAFATPRITVAEGFNIYPTAAEVMVFDHYSYEDYKSALDRGLNRINLIGYLEDKTASFALVASQYEYAIPSGFQQVRSLRIVPSSSSLDYSADDDTNRIFDLDGFWHIELNSGGSRVVVFDPRKVHLSNVGDNRMEMMGQAWADVTGSDNATIPPAVEDYLEEFIATRLARSRSGESKELNQKFVDHARTLSALELYVRVPPRGEKVE